MAAKVVADDRAALSAVAPNSSEYVHIMAEDLVVRYGPVVALDHFSVKVLKGIVGLLGPNGAGKSTFIKAVLVILPVVGVLTIFWGIIKSRWGR